MFKFEVTGTTAEGFKNNLDAAYRLFHAEQLPLPFPSSVSAASENAKASEASVSEKPKATRAKKEKAEAAPATTTAPAQENAVELDTVKDTLKKLIETGDAGMAKGYEILKSFGAEKLSELKDAHFADFVNKVNLALAN